MNPAQHIILPRFFAVLLTLAIGLSTACAEKGQEATDAKASPGVAASDAEAVIRERFKASRPDVEIEAVEPSEVSGIYHVRLKNGPGIYVSEDGRHFFLGDLFAVTDDGFQNLAESRRNEERKALINAVSREDMIIFSPEGETKGAVYVFTDVDCGYCQKLHQEVPQLNALGVEVRYLAYPRAGLGTPTYQKMVSAWCSEDRRAAMNMLKARKPIDPKSCENPVADEYKLGIQIGVTGTPAIVTTDGKLIPGYVPAEKLAEVVLPQES